LAAEETVLRREVALDVDEAEDPLGRANGEQKRGEAPIEWPLPRMLALFRDAHPRVEVVLQELDTHHAARGLADHAIDLALVRHLATPTGLERTRPPPS
jgi:DNA-binding transcriptional LysR family regulator